MDFPDVIYADTDLVCGEEPKFGWEKYIKASTVLVAKDKKIGTSKFSQKQQELAIKVANDIAEGIDCLESRAELRSVISYWAGIATKEAIRRDAAESRLTLFGTAKKLMDEALRE